LVQFSGEFINRPDPLMTSDGGTGCVAQPARNISAQQKTIPACVAEAPPT
jgi:hypothetical protein